MSKRLILLLLPCVVWFCGCSHESGPVDAAQQVGSYIDENAMVEVCMGVQAAAEEHAERFGQYPAEVGAGAAAGMLTCVVREIPNGGMPDGPVTEWAEIPGGSEAIEPGTISYTVIRWEGWNLGYIVVGYEANGPAVIVTSGESREETVVRLNCLHLKAAVEEFAARNGGEYAADVSEDRTPGGAAVLDLLPRAHLCRNPFTGGETVPVDRTPVSPGEIGYTAIQEFNHYEGMVVRGRRIGYVISGHGESEITCVINNCGYSSKDARVIQNCLTVERAAQLFARNNSDVFPLTLADCNYTGNTLIDYLPNGCLLANPYTGLKTEPIDCVACNPGETGYTMVYCGGSGRCCGYCITGAGANCLTICTLYHGPPEDDAH